MRWRSHLEISGVGPVLKIDSPTDRPSVRPSATAGSPMGIAGRGRAGDGWGGGAGGRRSPEGGGRGRVLYFWES